MLKQKTHIEYADIRYSRYVFEAPSYLS